MNLPSLEDYKSKEAKMACIFALWIFVVIMGFYLKEDAGNTPRPSMAGISTLTKTKNWR